MLNNNSTEKFEIPSGGFYRHMNGGHNTKTNQRSNMAPAYHNPENSFLNFENAYSRFKLVDGDAAGSAFPRFPASKGNLSVFPTGGTELSPTATYSSLTLLDGSSFGRTPSRAGSVGDASSNSYSRPFSPSSYSAFGGSPFVELALSESNHSSTSFNDRVKQQHLGSVKNRSFPTTVCSYYTKSVNGIGQGCLRVNCKFFHGSERQLEELRKKQKHHQRTFFGTDSSLSSRSASTASSALHDAPIDDIHGEVPSVALNATSFVDSLVSENSSARQVEEEPCPQRLRMVKDAELGNKKPIVCLNYLTDACYRPGCRFLHLPSNVRPLPMTVCEYFANGSCTRKRCRFFHGPKELLSKMHAQGVTMYNPSTNEPHDPSSSLDELMRLQERTTVPLGPVLASDVNAQKESRVPSGQRGRKSKAPLKARSTATAPAGPSIADQGTFLFPTPTIPPAYTTQVPSAVHQHMPFPVPSASGIGSNAAYLPPNPHASVAPNTTITVIHHHHHHLDAGNEASGLSKTNLESASHIVSTEYTTIVTNGAEVPESVLLALMQQHPNTKFVSTTPLNPPIPSAPAARAAQIPHRGVDQLTNDPVVHASNASVTKEAQWRTLLLQPTADCPQWGAVE